MLRTQPLSPLSFDAAAAAAEIRRLRKAENGSMPAAIERAVNFGNEWLDSHAPDADVLCEMGICRERGGQPDKAQKCYLDAHEINPTLGRPLVSLGELARRQGNHGEADHYFKKALRTDDVHAQADAHRGLGHIAKHHKRFADAAQHYHAALKLEPTDPEPLVNLAAIDRREGHDKAAIEKCLEALALNPSMPSAHNCLSAIYMDMQEFDRASEHVEKSLSLMPNNVAALTNKGLIHLHTGNIAEGIAQLTAINKTRLHAPSMNALKYLANHGIGTHAYRVLVKSIENHYPPGTLHKYKIAPHVTQLDDTVAASLPPDLLEHFNATDHAVRAPLPESMIVHEFAQQARR